MTTLGKVCINPGHGPLNSGRFDPGALGKSGLKEASINLDIARLVDEYLRKAGWDTLVVQDGDLADVVRKSNAFPADYFISIHCNAFSNSSANGVETYAYKPGGQGQKIAAAVQAELVRSTGLKDRGVKYANFYVLKYTLCPAVLVEAGFITNLLEENLLKQSEFQGKIAKAISLGFNQVVNKAVR